jgi:hypothetical protein
MKRPSHTALVARAKDIVHRMHDVERWAYATVASVPSELRAAAVRDAGYAVVEEDPEAKVVRYEAPAESEASLPDTLVTLERSDLGVVLMQAYGPKTVDRLAPILEKTGFVPQSLLLERAYEVGSSDASQALTILAHMVVAWDEDWGDLFLLHLASPDPVSRHEAALATVVAAFSARQVEPARTLLGEALRRETFPKLRETLTEAVQSVEAMPQVGRAPFGPD